ncbi:MAG: cupredoxin domain-containing protein [Dehalococcoidia bacterium]|nr:cupredoxin domain-containing protein [Dehalococcoidia bacterium]
MRKILVPAVAAALVAVFAACGAGTSSTDKTATAGAGAGVGGAATAPSSSPTAAAAASPTSAASGTTTAAPSGTGTSGAAGGSVSLQLATPDDTRFDKSTLTVSPGAKVTLTYTNSSELPHNWHLFNGNSASGETIAKTDIKSGPNDVQTVTFTAPTTPGQYFFRCDVHPQQMTGFLVVQ